ncbi:hypothetical protein F5146DRAFT_1001632 [Armillaria mellea]|nr:hypothetical protein F5146DRAFT_1001632 [Armillaria mellea]
MDTAQDHDTEASSKNKGSFIAEDDEEYSDNVVGTVDLESSPVPSIQVGEQIWNWFAGESKGAGELKGKHATDSIMLYIVVFHIGQCVPVELHIRAAFIMPYLDDRQVWLEAEMSWALKAWLIDIPGMYTPSLPMVNGTWVKVWRGQFKGQVGMMAKGYPWGCKVLLVPTLDGDSTYTEMHQELERHDIADVLGNSEW